MIAVELYQSMDEIDSDGSVIALANDLPLLLKWTPIDELWRGIESEREKDAFLDGQGMVWRGEFIASFSEYLSMSTDIPNVVIFLQLQKKNIFCGYRFANQMVL